MHEDLKRLAVVDSLDRSSHATRRRRDKARQGVADAEGAVAAASTARDEAQAALDANRTEERALQRRLDEGRRHQGNALRLLETGQGDPEGAQRQLEKSTALIDELETALLEVLETQDERQGRIAACLATLAEAEQELQTRREALPGIEQDASAALARDADARAPVFGELPDDIRTRYEAFRAKGRWAVAPISGGACGACYQVVQQQHVSDIRRGIIKPCMGCHRWLVVDDDG